jgi:hypothetical protein
LPPVVVSSIDSLRGSNCSFFISMNPKHHFR